jgi:anti-anti-sigma factor
MATNPVFRGPELTFDVDTKSDGSIVRCSGRITSDTTQLLGTTVKPLIPQNKTLVLDLTNVSYMDSSGLGAIVGLYISAKTAKHQLKLINLNQRLKELFSLTRLGEAMAAGRDPTNMGLP